MREAAPTAVSGVTTSDRGSDRNCQQRSRSFFLNFFHRLLDSDFFTSFYISENRITDFIVFRFSPVIHEYIVALSDWLFCTWNSKHLRLLPRRWPVDDRTWPIGQRSVKGVRLSTTRRGVALDMTEDRYNKVRLSAAIGHCLDLNWNWRPMEQRDQIGRWEGATDRMIDHSWAAEQVRKNI